MATMGETTRSYRLAGAGRLGAVIVVFLAVQKIVCSAQSVTLPPELSITDLRSLVDCDSCLDEHNSCGQQFSTVSLCSEICKDCPNPMCWEDDTGGTCGREMYTAYCYYSDAYVCRHETQSDSFCVYFHDPNDKEFCTDDRLVSSTAGSFTTMPPTSLGGDTTMPPTSPGGDTVGPGDDSARINKAAVSIACILALVLLLVILFWYLQRRGLLRCRNRNRKRTAETSTGDNQDVSFNRPPVSEPPALDSREYSYAYGQRPDGQNEPDTGIAKVAQRTDIEGHYYSVLDGERSERYTDKPGSPLPQEGSSTVAPDDPRQPALENPNGKTDMLGSKASNSSPGKGDHQEPKLVREKPSSGYVDMTGDDVIDVSLSTEARDDIEYFVLENPDDIQETQNEDSEMGEPGTEGANLPHPGGNDHTYFPLLKPNQQPPGKDDNSGYETAKLPTLTPDEEYNHLERVGRNKATGAPYSIATTVMITTIWRLQIAVRRNILTS